MQIFEVFKWFPFIVLVIAVPLVILSMIFQLIFCWYYPFKRIDIYFRENIRNLLRKCRKFFLVSITVLIIFLVALIISIQYSFTKYVSDNYDQIPSEYLSSELFSAVVEFIVPTKESISHLSLTSPVNAEQLSPVINDSSRMLIEKNANNARDGVGEREVLDERQLNKFQSIQLIQPKVIKLTKKEFNSKFIYYLINSFFIFGVSLIFIIRYFYTILKEDYKRFNDNYVNYYLEYNKILNNPSKKNEREAYAFRIYLLLREEYYVFYKYLVVFNTFNIKGIFFNSLNPKFYLSNALYVFGMDEYLDNWYKAYKIINDCRFETYTINNSLYLELRQYFEEIKKEEKNKNKKFDGENYIVLDDCFVKFVIFSKDNK